MNITMTNSITMKRIPYLILSGMILYFSTSCTREIPEIKNVEQTIYVKTELLDESINTLSIHSPGILSSKQVIQLSFKTGGIIACIQVEEGSEVKKGQVMASLDMTEIASQVGQIKLGFEKAERDLLRVKSLYNDTVATLEQLQDATSAYEVALESKSIAEFNQRYSRITAPADGKIIARLAEEHELVGPGMPVLVFSEKGKEEWVVKVGLSDKDIVRIKRGDKAEVFFDAYPGKNFTGYVSQIAEMSDPQSGTFEAEVTLIPQQERLINGLVANVIIEPKNSQKFTMVPPEALSEVNGLNGYVYVVEDEDTTARKVPVTIAFFGEDEIAVVESVNQLGAVITEGVGYLEDGIKLSVGK
jgi:RND family efflux transporter MFP subunit